MNITYLLVFCAILNTFVSGFQTTLYEGDTCHVGSSAGICKVITDCQTALALIGKGLHPETCSWLNLKTPIVCCVENVTTISDTKSRITDVNQTNTEEEKHEDNRTTAAQNIRESDKERSVRKANEMCGCYHNYEDPNVHTCGSIASRSSWSSFDEEKITDPRIIEGELAGSREFPHMVALGFEGADGNIGWHCGGSLISSKHVLTAAHCLHNHGVLVTHVRIGDVNMRENASLSRQNFRVASRERHPLYHRSKIYHDIAILTLDSLVEFSEFARPACLSTRVVTAPSPCVATGWGVDSWHATEGSSDLKKADLQVHPLAMCNRTYMSIIGNRRQLSHGVDESMICAGDPEEIRDTCNGDSGGPLQVESANYTDMFEIIGVTSFGTKCTASTSPAIYTRVSNYLPWIVSKVWPTP